MAATSDTDILNDALIQIGEQRINSIDDDNKRARLGKIIYDKARDALLRAHPWNFAVKRIELTSASSTAPVYGFSKAFNLPDDFLRFIKTEAPNYPFALENHLGSRAILADRSSVQFRYVADVTDPNQFDELFKRVLATRIALDLAISLTRNQSLRDRLRAEFEDTMAEAQFADSQEAPIQTLEPIEWLNARFGGRERWFRDEPL